LFGCFNTQNLWVVFLQLVANPSRWELISEFLCLIFATMKLMIYPIGSQYFPSSLGARPVLLMGVAPEAIVEYFQV
jgi:hypothetical protein